MNAVTMHWNRVSETGLPKTEPNTDTEFIVAVHRRAQDRIAVFAASFLNAKQLYSADEMGDINHDEGTKPVTGWYIQQADDPNQDACWWNIIDDGSGDEVAAWMAMPSEPIFFVAAKHCEACGDTGRMPGSDYLDCGHCGVASERNAIEREAISFAIDYKGPLEQMPSDMRWHFHQRATRIAEEKAAGQLVKERQRTVDVGVIALDAEPYRRRIAELERQVAEAGPDIEAIGWAYKTLLNMGYGGTSNQNTALMLDRLNLMLRAAPAPGEG